MAPKVKHASRRPSTKSKLDRAALERLSEVFTAFSDTTRLALLQELTGGPKNVNQLIEAVGTTQANVSRQLKVLHQAGLLKREQKAQFVIYSIANTLVLDLCNAACKHLNHEVNTTSVIEFSI